MTTKTNMYKDLCQVAEIQPFDQAISLNSFLITDELAKKTLQERFAAALQVFLSLFKDDLSAIERIDKSIIDVYITRIDEAISQQLDSILHASAFQALESLWRGLDHLVSETDFRANTKIAILDASKAALQDDFNEATDTTQS